MSDLVKTKDSKWLQIEICQDFLRKQCPRSNDCRFAHPLGGVEIINGKVVACYDSFKDRCIREVCKYYHPPPHIMQEMMLKGRNQMALKQTSQSIPFMPMSTPMFLPMPIEPSVYLPETSGLQLGLKRPAEDGSLESFYPGVSFCKRTAVESFYPYASAFSYQPLNYSIPVPSERK